MTELCQADYPDSRICTSEEYAKTITFPGAIPNTTYAWIIPSVATGTGTGTVRDVFSGKNALNCEGWRTVGDNTDGLSVNGVGSFFFNTCNTLLPVSCCK